ncbi:MAG: nucleotidyltransferase family protein [Methanobacteriaceae archaeon]|nr:nucleotidyltransferase family protein [Methanobacteriaceae archaeon]
MQLPFRIKKEDELLIHLSHTPIETKKQTKIQKIIQKGVDWDYLLKRASYHGLRPMLYYTLKNYPNSVPFDVLNFLKDFLVKNSYKNLSFTGEVLRIIKLLDEADVTTIPYKGPVLAIQGYDNLSLREFGDLDLFIEKRDFYKVKRILINENFEAVLNLSPSKEKKYLKSQREYKFKNRHNGIILEIQWNVVGFSFSFPNETSYPIDKINLQSVFMNNRSIKTFSNEDLILILSIHVAGHMWSRLSWLYDLASLIKKFEDLNWGVMIKKAEKLGVQRILFSNLYILQILFNLRYPKIVNKGIKKDFYIQELSKNILYLIFTPEKLNIMDKFILRFKIRESKIQGFKDNLKILIIPQSDEWALFERDLPNSLFILIRPLQIINRLFEGL